MQIYLKLNKTWRLGISIKDLRYFEIRSFSSFFVEDIQKIRTIFENDKIIKLFYQSHYMYKGNTNNWGNSKGETNEEVCVVLNSKTLKYFNENTLKDKMAETALCKLYVACTRSLGNVYLISEKNIPNDFKIN